MGDLDHPPTQVWHPTPIEPGASTFVILKTCHVTNHSYYSEFLFIIYLYIIG